MNKERNRSKRHWRRGQWVICYLLACFSYAQAQQVQGVLQGVIREGQHNETIHGATITIGDVGAMSDENGFFELRSSPGTFSVQVSHLGFKTRVFPEIQIVANQTKSLVIKLSPETLMLAGVSVVEKVPTIQAGSRKITQEQVNRLPSTYYDPARLVTNISDAAVTNDQNNRISIRGLSPDYNQWRLEGARITNPNHLTNAGTVSDQPTISGGGVNAISAQMLDNSSLQYGMLLPNYGNAVGGVFDFHMSTKTSDRLEYSAQASFIGFDFTAGGLIRPKTSFLANYRYSFTGLLAAMGVDFGGEAIAFQDLSAAIETPMARGTIKFFGTAGSSSNDFTHKPLDERELTKDGSDILYQGRLGILGATYQGKIGEAVKMTHTMAWSTTRDRREEVVFVGESPTEERDSKLAHEVLGLYSNFIWNDFSVGWDWSLDRFDNSEQRLVPTATGSIDEAISLFRPYLSYTAKFGDRWRWVPTITAPVTSESKAQLNWRSRLSYLMPYAELSISAGRFTQVLPPSSGLSQFDPMLVSADPNFPITTVRKFILSWEGWGLTNLFDYVVEAFHYRYDDVLDAGFGLPFVGLGANRELFGLSINVDKNYQNGLYYLAGVTLLDEVAQYDRLTNINGGLGVSRKLDKSDRKRILDFGLRYTSSSEIGDVFGGQIFSRADFRVKWAVNKPKATVTWALDIQNVFNRKNFFFRDGAETVYQLGFLPIFAYRIDF